ncbi:MAG TPA: multicopper oxidase domain-containing protein [Rhodanobacteraceae bacterium]
MAGILRGAFLIGLLLLAACAGSPAGTPSKSGAPEIQANDNRTPAGHLADGVLSLGIEVREGDWWPERAMPPNRLLAFAETGGRLTTPGPLIRVREGTQVEIAWHNPTDADIYIHGFNERADAEPLRVPAHGDAATRYRASNIGTFYYWGTLKPAAEFSQDRDSQLVGGLIVDPPNGSGNDRIFVIKRLGNNDEHVFVGNGLGAWTINGRSWPDTERLTYTVGENVQWRFVNASNDTHPLHLHGTYFRVTSRGDATRDVAVPADRQEMVVTEAMRPGTTMSITWSPERPGNWLFHCHLVFHVIPENRLPEPLWYDEYAKLPHDQHMSGLVLGIHAVAASETTAAVQIAEPRRMTLHVAERPGVRYIGDGLDEPGLGYALDDGPVSTPGPTLTLERGKPVEITIVNEIGHSTSVHWHGIELESYYDGVPHWGGDAQHVTPDIPPGGQFVARFTPPRAGTFIYHTHFNDYPQLAGGLYGALIITDPGHPLSPDTDHVFVFSENGYQDERDPVLVNGAVEPPTATWRAGSHRIRLIGVTPNVHVRVRLLRDDVAVVWTPRARDGADLPESLRTAAPAEVDVFPGQTYDYDVAVEPGDLRLEAVTDGETKLRAVAALTVQR